MGDFLRPYEINNISRKTVHTGTVSEGCTVHNIIHLVIVYHRWTSFVCISLFVQL